MDQAEGLRRLAMTPRGQDRPGSVAAGARVIAIASGKGGVGKTHLAVNLGIALAQRGLRVGLLDADLGLANVDILLGLTPTYTLADVILGDMSLSDIRLTGPAGLLVFPGGSGVEALAQVSPAQISRFLDRITALDDELDVLLIDTAAGIGPTVTAFVEGAGEMIVVTTPEPTAITDAYALVKNTGRKAGAGRLHLVVNHARSENEARNVCRNLNLVLRRFTAEPAVLELLGYLTYDAQVTRAALTQVPLILSQPSGPVARSLYRMADKLRGIPPAAGQGVGRLFRVLSDRLRREI